ncbi:MAG: (Fe-S)-binding protein [Candidatus Aminicenantes bacterium]|nr:(Fe-S)-binding protein [Candidatus Aminicenantes bacterium]
MPDINEIAKVCSTCGNCLYSCPVYNAELEEPNSPRGKVNLIKSLMDGRLETNRLNKKFIYQCLLCGSCTDTCPKGVEFVDMMVKYRNLISSGKKIPLLKKLILIFYQSFLFRKFIPVVDLLAKTPLRKKLSLPIRRKTKLKKLLTPAKKGGSYDILLFPGCVLTYFYPVLIEKIVEFLKGRGFSVVVPKNLQCCGFPYISQGWQKKFSALKKKNRKIFSAFNFKYLLVPCSTGLLAFDNYYGFGHTVEKYELTEFIYKFAKDAPVKLEIPGEKKSKITYHDPCHDLKLLKIEKEPRFFMKQLGDDFVDDKSALCCGFGGIFSAGFPATAEKILARKEAVLEEIGAGTVVTSCPGCYFRLRENLSRDVKFFIELFPAARGGDGVPSL